jgi:hypothetical protein
MLSQVMSGSNKDLAMRWSSCSVEQIQSRWKTGSPVAGLLGGLTRQMQSQCLRLLNLQVKSNGDEPGATIAGCAWVDALSVDDYLVDGRQSKTSSVRRLIWNINPPC